MPNVPITPHGAVAAASPPISRCSTFIDEAS